MLRPSDIGFRIGKGIDCSPVKSVSKTYVVDDASGDAGSISVAEIAARIVLPPSMARSTRTRDEPGILVSKSAS